MHSNVVLENSNNLLYGTITNNINDSDQANSAIVKSDSVARGYFITIDSYNNLNKEAKYYVTLGSVATGIGLVAIIILIFDTIFGERKLVPSFQYTGSLINIFSLACYCLSRGGAIWHSMDEMKKIPIVKDPCSNSNSSRVINYENGKEIKIAFENRHGI